MLKKFPGIGVTSHGRSIEIKKSKNTLKKKKVSSFNGLLWEPWEV